MCHAASSIAGTGVILDYGYDGLANQPPHARRFWNKIPQSEKERVVDTALKKPELTPRELAWHITDS